MKKAAYIFLTCSIVLAVLPLLSVLLAAFAADLFSCNLNEGDISQCPTVFGDLGGLLYAMGVFGWFVFYTVPLGLCGLFISVVLFVVSFLHKRKTKA